MENEIKGEVRNIKQRDKNFSVLIEDSWYNGLGKTDLKKGDVVKLSYKQNGDFKNIEHITRIGEIMSQPLKAMPNKEKTMLKMNALNNAVCLLSLVGFEAGGSADLAVEESVRIADRLVAYLQK